MSSGALRVNHTGLREPGRGLSLDQGVWLKAPDLVQGEDLRVKGWTGRALLGVFSAVGRGSLLAHPPTAPPGASHS